MPGTRGGSHPSAAAAPASASALAPVEPHEPLADEPPVSSLRSPQESEPRMDTMLLRSLPERAMLSDSRLLARVGGARCFAAALAAGRTSSSSTKPTVSLGLLPALMVPWGTLFQGASQLG